MSDRPCELCAADGGRVLFRDDFLRVVLAAEPDYPGFCRVILTRHVRETAELRPAERRRLMEVVFATEDEVRRATGAFKMNLASLGNVVPHVHWHVIPRRGDDARFPDPIWGPARRAAVPPPFDPEPLAAALARRLAALSQDY
jgi:diadenosine tetraphosphate (Ap4A) HIT family hydrolase